MTQNSNGLIKIRVEIMKHLSNMNWGKTCQVDVFHNDNENSVGVLRFFNVVFVTFKIIKGLQFVLGQ